MVWVMGNARVRGDGRTAHVSKAATESSAREPFDVKVGAVSGADHVF